MGFELARINKKKEKRKKRSKRFMITMTALTIIGVSGVSFIGYKIYQQYTATDTWDKTAIEGDLANMTPEFAKNHISAEMLDDVNSLSNVTKLLKTISEQNGLNDQTVNDAKTMLEKSQSILKKHKIINGEAFTNQENLKLYIDIYEVEKNSYSEFKADELSRVMTLLSSKNLKNHNKGDTNIMNRLNIIATSYNNLNNFVDTYIPMLGTVDNGILTLGTNIDEDVTANMLKTIDEDSLDKFDNIRSLKKLLTSTKWKNAVKKNKATADKSTWDAVYAALTSMSKSDYIKYSDVATYADALKLGLPVYNLETRTGYEILETSVVKSITVNGVNVKPGQYFKNTGTVAVTISPNYKEIQTTTTSSSTTEKRQSSSVSEPTTSESNSSDSSSTETSTTRTETTE